MPLSNADSYQRIYKTVKRIPRGRVATYGQIATLAGLDGHARQVGYALHSLPDRSDIPWHRVVRADGSMPKGAPQRQLLLREGVPMRGERVDLDQARFPPEL